MLVLTRKAGQKLIIDNNIEITVLDVRGDSVKIGVNAPKAVSIYREEIYDEIRQTNQQASSAASPQILENASQWLPHTAVIKPTP